MAQNILLVASITYNLEMTDSESDTRKIQRNIYPHHEPENLKITEDRLRITFKIDSDFTSHEMGGIKARPKLFHLSNFRSIDQNLTISIEKLNGLNELDL